MEPLLGIVLRVEVTVSMVSKATALLVRLAALELTMSFARLVFLNKVVASEVDIPSSCMPLIDRRTSPIEGGRRREEGGGRREEGGGRREGGNEGGMGKGR